MLGIPEPRARVAPRSKPRSRLGLIPGLAFDPAVIASAAAAATTTGSCPNAPGSRAGHSASTARSSPDLPLEPHDVPDRWSCHAERMSAERT